MITFSLVEKDVQVEALKEKETISNKINHKLAIIVKVTVYGVRHNCAVEFEAIVGHGNINGLLNAAIGQRNNMKCHDACQIYIESSSNWFQSQPGNDLCHGNMHRVADK